MNEALRAELIEMKDHDFRVRQRLLDEGKLGGFYVPEMEAVHRQNAARLREVIAEYGWPHEEIAGEDGAKAAWLIAQHAIGEPDFQRQSLQHLQRHTAEGKLPAWHAAYLEDRIAVQEGRPQRYGTQWVDDIRDGLARPFPLEIPSASTNCVPPWASARCSRSHCVAPTCPRKYRSRSEPLARHGRHGL